MRITLAYNLRTADVPEQYERLPRGDVDRLVRTLESLGHEVAPVEMSGHLPEAVDRLVDSRPELVFNVAEGAGRGRGREAQSSSNDGMGPSGPGAHPKTSPPTRARRCSPSRSGPSTPCPVPTWGGWTSGCGPTAFPSCWR